ncbi:MAG: hypothetical protein RR294_06190 [Bacilli bacterium]
MGDRRKAQQLRRIKNIPSDNKLKFLWDMMLEEDLVQKDIAAILNCTRQYICHMMNAEDMKLSLLKKIGEATSRELICYYAPRNVLGDKSEIEKQLKENGQEYKQEQLKKLTDIEKTIALIKKSLEGELPLNI